MIYESFSISKILENDLSAPKNIKRFGFRFANNSKFQGKIAEHDKNNLEKLLKRNSLYNLEKMEFIIQRYEEKIEKKELEVFNRIALILFVIALFEFIGSEMFHYTIRVLTVIVLATIVFLPMIGKKILMNFKGNPMMSISTEKYFVDLLGEIYLEIKE